MRFFSIILTLILVAGFSASCSYRFYTAGCEFPVPGNMVKNSSLDSTLAETSGLLYLDGGFWTFNDSGEGRPSMVLIPITVA